LVLLITNSAQHQLPIFI